MQDKEQEPLKPKSSAPPVEVDDLSSIEDSQERIAEKLSISVPTQPLIRPTGLGTFFGKQVRLLLRDGSVINGLLQKRLFDYLYLLNIVEVGKDYKLSANSCAVDLASVARVYPGNTKVEKI
jgi:hypothetical protein